jgi:hypothetical protein
MVNLTSRDEIAEKQWATGDCRGRIQNEGLSCFVLRRSQISHVGTSSWRELDECRMNSGDN